MIGDNLLELRIKKKLTQQALANKSNIDRSMISKIEKNKTQPSLSTLENIAKALEVSVSELIKISN